MPRTDNHAELFDVMYSCRAMRRLKPDPVPEDVLLALVDAAVQSPSGSDSQNWRFVIVRDRGTLAEIQRIWRTGWAFYKDTLGAIPPRPGEDLAARERSRKAGEYMVEHLHETPALVFVCVKRDAADC
jgi:nitroreductase